MLRPLVLALVVVTQCKIGFTKLPPGLETCSRNDPKLNECFVEKINKALRLLTNGVPTMSIQPIDPLHADEVIIDDTSTNRQVAVNLRMYNIDFIGFAQSNIVSAKIDLDGGKIFWHSVIPTLQILGQYEVSGRVLILPVVGKGNFNFTLVNLNTSFELDFTKEIKNKKEYIVVLDSRHNFEDPSSAYIRLDGLFDGDKRLSDHMNEFMNENWRPMMMDMGPPLTEVIKVSTIDVLRKVFAQATYDTIFPS